MRINGISPSPQFLLLVFAVTFLHRVSAASAVCELSVTDNNNVYYYSLESPVADFPHGILSEDGHYKVAANGTVVWFQLCGSMIFNHDPPLCVGCKDCGGQSRCGMGCSALVSNKIEGYPVCTTLGQPSSTLIDVLDKKRPDKGIIVKMTHSALRRNCSLSVSVICNSNGVQGPQTLENVGSCDYNTELKHPLGCAKIISSNGNGLGWFGTFFIIVLCLFGSYLLAGAVYRYFFLNVRGIDVWFIYLWIGIMLGIFPINEFHASLSTLPYPLFGLLAKTA
ncbi:autophagy-like protein [Perilla frutescens var. hirtella]|uniref:Autophagy-like protein n=1 Tax=Perilla frutescens var. hirtella TaxID=608512 RepID=A0AAD4JPZ6_PERFH|nr:autophagy-like protein [Perilla frutescens var. hirtella]KAH6805485.1 autophagy-like protein [Perilla frutescens var. frutescens]KAH6837456.1 autophagy-like protein [Perilla frutescens var. hirtella]